MPTDTTVEKYSNFERLKAGYKQHILEACIEEFSSNGYEFSFNQRYRQACRHP